MDSQICGHRLQKGISRIQGVVLAVLALVLLLAVVAGWVKYASKRDLSDRMWAFQICLWELWCRVELPDNVTYDKSGKPACSWRFACYVWVNGGGSATVKMVDTTVPWDSGTLEQWQHTISPEYCLSGTTETNVMAVVGEGTGFEKGKRFHERDLPGDLVLILEVQGTGVHWMAPGDLHVSELANILCGGDPTISLGTSQQGFLVGFADGEVWMLAREVPKERLLMFCSREGATLHDREDSLSAFRLARRPRTYR